ncbi:hypothetical protein [Colwellia sp. UCD-KL20]|uniref:hypothetical protein n=1 Tax=Colwellia sp. UCD-KL20 TaxID=1917165 RepID=UPI000970CC37|nr:hypothetical protein [Colwellia sp. UCD-KL20]
MIDIKKFDGIKKTSAKSFNNQKALIKKVMAGKVITCETCGTPIKLVLPEQSKTPGLYCTKGCTDIALDFEL